MPELTIPRGYLEGKKTTRPQYKTTRTQLVTAALLHTTESVLDVSGPDTGAERVAEFIRTRSDGAGSYHVVADSDSFVFLGPPSWEFFHCRGGVNAWTVGLSFACKASDWPGMDPARRTRMLRNGAKGLALLIRWIEVGQAPGFYPSDWRPSQNPGQGFPIRRITGKEAKAGALGITTHAEMDPGRRSDPGPGFPWAEFLPMVREEHAALLRPATVPEKDDKTEVSRVASIQPVEMKMQERAWTLFDHLGTTIERIEELYTLTRGDGPDVRTWTRPEVRYWVNVAAERLIVGESPEPILRDLATALKAEPESDDV